MINSSAIPQGMRRTIHMNPLKNQAIQTALMGDWQSAITYNQQILQEEPNDIDALNRLAFAFASIGNNKEAKDIYQKVLELDTQNPIAMRNLKRLTGSGNNRSQATGNAIAMNNIFIEEPGKTKVIELRNVAEQKTITQLRFGEFLNLSVKRMKIFVLDNQKQYIGMLPDDVSKRLIKFINGGNRYEAYVKSVDNHKVTIFIKETKRALRFKNQPSFVSFVQGDKKLNFGGHSKHSHDKHISDHEEDDTSYSSGDADESL